MLNSTVIHPRMLESVGNIFFRQSADIYAQDLAVGPDSFGQPPTPGLLPGHEGIRCSVQRSFIRSLEDRTDKMTVTTTRYAILLDGYYPAIKSRMQAKVDGMVTYDIQSVFQHSQRKYTQLEVEIVET